MSTPATSAPASVSPSSSPSVSPDPLGSLVLQLAFAVRDSQVQMVKMETRMMNMEYMFLHLKGWIEELQKNRPPLPLPVYGAILPRETSLKDMPKRT